MHVRKYACVHSFTYSSITAANEHTSTYGMLKTICLISSLKLLNFDSIFRQSINMLFIRSEPRPFLK